MCVIYTRFKNYISKYTLYESRIKKKTCKMTLIHITKRYAWAKKFLKKR